VLECKMRIQIATSKHNYKSAGFFIKKTTCFGPCTWSSLGLNLCVIRLFTGDTEKTFYVPRLRHLPTPYYTTYPLKCVPHLSPTLITLRI
jgi:hypothetical protein